MLELAGKYIKTVITAISHMFKKLRHGRLIKDLNQTSRHENYNEWDEKYIGNY